MTLALSQPPHLFDLSGKTALITGGSSSLGLQMAQALGQAGARIMLCAPQPDLLEAATAELQAAGIDARWVAADCALEADLQKLMSETLHRMGDVDVLVNNAGSSGALPAQHDPLKAWDQAMSLNLRACFWLSQLVGQHSMIARRSGRIINLASLVDQPPALARLASTTARAAVISLTRALACEWGQYNITVNAICPGWFSSDISSVAMLAEPARDQWLGWVPLQRPGDGQDIQGATLLLASDAGKYITGQWLAVDGGASAAGLIGLGT